MQLELAQPLNPASAVDRVADDGYSLIMRAVNKRYRTTLDSDGFFTRDLLRFLFVNAIGIDPDKINQNPDIIAAMNRVANNGYSLIMHAVFNKYRTEIQNRLLAPDIVQLLVNAGCDVNATTGDGVLYRGDTALYFAVCDDEHGEPNIWVIKKLIECGADINAGRVTPLMEAAGYSRNATIVRMLLSHQADVGIKDGEGNIALDHAVMPFYNPKPNSNYLNTDIVRMLIEAGSDVNNRDEFNSSPLLHVVYDPDCAEIVQLLLEAGADWRVRDDDGSTVLMKCVWGYARIDAVKLLLDAGCSKTINKRDKDGRSALHFAINHGAVETVRLLLTVKDIEMRMSECYQASVTTPYKMETLPCCAGKANECLREVAALVIQRHWRECYYNPKYLVCRNRLMEEGKVLERDVKRLRSK